MKHELHTDAPDGWSPPGERASGPAGLPWLLPARYGGGSATLGDHLARHGPLPRCAKDPRRRDALITEPGSMLITLIGAVRRHGVYEIEIGTPVDQVLGLVGGPAAPLEALLLGGYFGTWVPWRAAAALPLSAAGLAVLGAGPGAGLVAALPDDACGLAETARVARYLADESAGQCGPCVFGLDAVGGQLEALARGGGGDLVRLRRALAQADGRGACRHPDGAVRMVHSALTVFSDEIDQHAAGWCRDTGAADLLPVPPRVPR